MRKVYSNKRLLCKCQDEEIYCCQSKLIIVKEQKSTKINLPINELYSVLCKFRIFIRLFRMEPRFAISIDKNKYLVSFKGAMYLLDTVSYTLKKELTYRVGMNNPLDICVVENADNSKEAYFGEYWGNEKKESVDIYKRNKEGKWSIIFEFSKRTITHIHQIQYDKYRDCFWILTGDEDTESGIWRADKNFKDVYPLMKGKQQYRSCFVIPKKNGLIYATDTPLEDNYVYYYEMETGESRVIYELPGPCIYAKILNNETFVCGTSVEPDSSLSKWKYRLYNRRGRGIKTNKAYLIYISTNFEVHILDAIKKDNYNMWLFQFGNFQFPNVDVNDNNIYYTATALKKYDGKTIVCRIKDNDEEHRK